MSLTKSADHKHYHCHCHRPPHIHVVYNNKNNNNNNNVIKPLAKVLKICCSLYTIQLEISIELTHLTRRQNERQGHSLKQNT